MFNFGYLAEKLLGQVGLYNASLTGMCTEHVQTSNVVEFASRLELEGAYMTN